jgi:hypothetical protein
VQVVDFRQNLDSITFVEKTVKLGEILVSPVCAKYDVAGVGHSKVFWLVVVKTRRCFDLAGHIHDIVTNQVSM